MLLFVRAAVELQLYLVAGLVLLQHRVNCGKGGDVLAVQLGDNVVLLQIRVTAGAVLVNGFD